MRVLSLKIDAHIFIKIDFCRFHFYGTPAGRSGIFLISFIRLLSIELMNYSPIIGRFISFTSDFYDYFFKAWATSILRHF